MHNLHMRISLVTPSQPEFWTGNRITADRWAGVLRGLGHDVRLGSFQADATCDMLIALHARKSAAAVQRFAGAHSDRPIIVALTGTDVYGDLHTDSTVLDSLECATRIVTLQPAAADELPQHLQDRVRVIYQSVVPPTDRPKKKDDVFEVCVIGNLRDEKDPFRTADAAKLLSDASRIHVIQIGAAHSADMERRARIESRDNDRYEWLGPLSRDRTLQRLAGARLMALTSKMEGGANVLSESIVCGVPILCSRISGSVGLLGEDYPGYFRVGDTLALSRLLFRAETDTEYYASLVERTGQLASLFEPAREHAAWKDLLDELS